MKNIEELESIIKVEFKNKDLLTQAMIHRSFLNEHPTFHLGHNERMEFLGDAVLELVVTEYLYNNYKNPEGELTNWRASLVNGAMLATASKELEIEEFLFLSKGETQDRNSKARNYILANAFEALVGAIYLDQGWDASKKFISRILITKLSYIIENELYTDAKSKFQEIAQEKENITPSYKVLSETGPDHAKIFEVAVCLNKEVVASAKGTSKQEAQTKAAEEGLKARGWI
ncbi:MAG: ribonuclease III [bacterium]